MYYYVFKKDSELGWKTLALVHEDEGLEAAEAYIQIDKDNIQRKMETRYYEWIT